MSFEVRRVEVAPERILQTLHRLYQDVALHVGTTGSGERRYFLSVHAPRFDRFAGCAPFSFAVDGDNAAQVIAAAGDMAAGVRLASWSVCA